jgi:hypothetical protein
MAEEAATTFVLRLKQEDLDGFDDGVVIGPGRFETMRKQFDRRRTIATPHQKPSCRCAESTDHPKNTLHASNPSLRSDADCLEYDALCSLDGGRIFDASLVWAGTFVGAGRTATL